MLIKITVRYCFIFIMMANFKRDNCNCWWECRKTPDRVQNHNHFGKKLAVSWKINHVPVLWPRNSTSRYFSRRNENVCPQKGMQKDVHNNFMLVPSWKEPKYPSRVNYGIIQVKDYCSVSKKNGLLIHPAIRASPPETMLSERSQTQNDTLNYSLYIKL